jgi:hypothetical protein
MAFENFQIGAADVRYKGVHLGHTNEDGVVVNYEPDVHMHMSGRFGTTPVKASIVGKKLEVTVNMAEMTLAKFETAFAGSDIDSNILNFGGKAGEELVGGELVVLPIFGNIRKWTFKNAVVTGAVEQEYSPSNEQILEVTFTAMVDEDALDAENIAEVS